MKFAYQGIPGSYSESCIKENYPDCEKTISCRTFQDAFELAKNNNNVKALVPEQNQLIGSINIETLILKYRLNIVAEHFFKISHNLLGLNESKISDITDVYSHAQALSQSSKFIKKNKFAEHVRADTAGSAKFVSEIKDKTKAAISSSLSAEIYNMKILAKNIQDNKEIDEVAVLKNQKNQLEIEKKQITTSLQSLEEENLKLRSQINELKKDYETSKRKENQFNEKIDELNQETDNLLEEIDKWQM